MLKYQIQRIYYELNRKESSSLPRQMIVNFLSYII